MKLPERFKPLLWAYDFDKVDITKDKELIITQVLNYGTWDDVKELLKIYSLEDVKEVIKNPARGRWFKKILNFWLTVLDVELPREKFERAVIDFLKYK